MLKHSVLLAVILVAGLFQSAAAQNTPSVSASVSGYTAIGIGIIPESEWVPITVTRNDGLLHAEAQGDGGRFVTDCTIPCRYSPAFTSASAVGFASANPDVLRIYGSNLAIATPLLNGPNVPSTANTRTVYTRILVGASFTDYLTVNFPGKAVGTPVQVPFNYLAEVVSDRILVYRADFQPIQVSASFNITGIGPQIFSTTSFLPYFNPTTLPNGNILHRLRSDNGFMVNARVGDVLTINASFGISGSANITDADRNETLDGTFADGRNTAGIWLGDLPSGMVITSASGHDYTVDPTTVSIPVVPAAVTATATPGNARATVSFTTPNGNGAAAITGYTVTSSPDGITATGTRSPIMITGLTNGTTYTFTVTSSNAQKMNTVSAPSNSITPSDNPVPTPVMGTATAGDAQAIVSFTAPDNDGGTAITGYTVTSSPDGITATATASPITVMGLTNGTAYTFTVTASNVLGISAASAPSNSVTPTATPASVPAAPTPAPTSGGSSGGGSVSMMLLLALSVVYGWRCRSNRRKKTGALSKHTVISAG